MGTRSGLNKAARSTLTGLAGLSDNIITKDDKLIMGVENVAGGNGSGNSVTLDADATFHFVTTATNSSHVTVADGVAGQVKYIIHKTRSNSTDLVITPTNFAAGSTLTSNLGSRSVGLVFDGTNWQVISGEITGTAEMVIG
jgi:hypothetical protein|tara:strand:+ start:129 stop:551 length:423 start_codon:yes stop_codon:yes gene_type:complete